MNASWEFFYQRYQSSIKMEDYPSLGKFLHPPTEGNESSLFLSWLQNRLREYYLKLDKLHLVTDKEGGGTSSNNHFEPTEVDIDDSEICFSELKLIEIQEDDNWYGGVESLSPDGEYIVKGIQCKSDASDKLLYETGSRRFTVTFQV